MTSTDQTPPTEQPANLYAKRLVDFFRRYPWRTAAVLLLALILIPAALVYMKYFRLVSRTLKNGPFANTSNIYSAPRLLVPGEVITPEAIVTGLERAGYSKQESNPKGWFRVAPDSVEVHPGPQSYFQANAARVKFNKGSISQLVSVGDGSSLQTYQLEPELITNIVDGDREKRRLVTFDEIPPVLVQAVVSAEDKRFFEHIGFDPLRLAKAAYVDARAQRKEQGASTITMQLARGLWLDPEKRWKRKFSELMITLVLEQRLSKKEIFQYYANQVYLGQSDSFSIHGFGEAARTFFGKDISQLNLPEAAMIAGMIQRPSYFHPVRNPEHTRERRNTVLRLMQDNHYITPVQYAAAVREPIRLAPRKLDIGDSPFFLALMNDDLQDRLQDNEDVGSLQVYSTLDPELQRAAIEAVRVAMPKLDAIAKSKHLAKDGVLPQVALVALDPHTGEVKAVVGGRDYGQSQLNHVLSMRQPGSAFKPFVYAAALTTAIDGSGTVFTPASTVVDQPSTFRFGTQVYTPSNFEKHFYGTVTLRNALAKSLNVATVTLAEKVGYDRIVKLARDCGLNENIQATPAVALGAYEATPLEMAGAYTVFANRGEYVKPAFVSQVTSNNHVILSSGSQHHRVLDPRITFQMDDMLQEVMRSGTAAGVRSQGFKAPAAGKTGTTPTDGWFAGFTPNLLCIVWVGFDDNRELNMEGAKSALPVWTEFMKRAVQYHPETKKFDPPPPGVVAVNIDPYSGLLAAPECGPPRADYFISGTQPTTICRPQADPFADLLGVGDETIPSGAADRAADQPMPRHSAPPQ